MFRRSRPRFPFPPGALLVGGGARDWLRGKAPKDFDWAAPQPQQSAQEVAAQTGGSVFVLDPARDYWRVHAPGGVQHDFVPLPADITTDLLRRDFTVNALALRPTGEVIDPAGGQRDLRGRRLRMVSSDNLWADPLRAWRAARLSLTLDFALDPATAAEVRALAAALASGEVPLPAAERIRDELHGLLLHPQAARGVALLEDLGLLALTLPELRAGMGVAQGGFHHLDVYGHSVEALHQLLARQPQASVPLRWAALLHDIGKPPTAAVDPQTGRRSFYGHDKVGAQLTRAALTRLKLPADDVAYAAQLVGAHMLPLPANEREAKRFVHRRRDLLPDLLSVMLADREAARGRSSSPASRYAYALGMERVLRALEDQPAPRAPLLSGQDIMALRGLEPGPRVGEAVRALAEAAALGEVHDAEQARAFLRAWAEETGR